MIFHDCSWQQYTFHCCLSSRPQYISRQRFSQGYIYINMWRYTDGFKLVVDMNYHKTWHLSSSSLKMKYEESNSRWNYSLSFQSSGDKYQRLGKLILSLGKWWCERREGWNSIWRTWKTEKKNRNRKKNYFNNRDRYETEDKELGCKFNKNFWHGEKGWKKVLPLKWRRIRAKHGWKQKGGEEFGNKPFIFHFKKERILCPKCRRHSAWKSVLRALLFHEFLHAFKPVI